MAASVTQIQTTGSLLTSDQLQLVTQKDMIRTFGESGDYVEMHITDPAGKNIFSIIPFTGYKIPDTFQPSSGLITTQDIEFYPAIDIQNLGLRNGDYIVTYNILRPKIVKTYNFPLFIKEISDDRKEIRLTSNNIGSDIFRNNAIDFILEFSGLSYFREFYINFGKNELIPAVNIALDNNNNTVLIKLLNPLPLKYKELTLLNVVDEISNPQSFKVSVTPDPIPVTFPTLRGPNFDLDLDNVRVGPTPYYNFNQVTHFNGQFAPQLQQLLGQLSASNFSINIDYTDYTDFIHFSSAARRLEGFKYKLDNIEYYTSASASAAQSLNVNAQADALLYQNKINGFIQSFDGYENYLYFESSSYTWPKTTSTKPYINASTASAAGVIWYAGMYDSASLYDDNNQNYLLYTLPGYIAENNDNELAFKFVASIGQMFDDIWIHIKAITDLYQAKNSLTEGISKDLVYLALQSMGIHVYNDQDDDNVFRYLYGVNPDGTYLPQTGSYETLISASNYQLSGQDIQKGIYKRIYHNLPLLLKSKGTTRFIQYLNTIFGIPSTIMSHIEYGGVDKLTSSFEYEFDRFTYGLNINGNNSEYVAIPWTYLSQSYNNYGSSNITPESIEFRFKISASSQNINVTQSLFRCEIPFPSYNERFKFSVIYTQTGSFDSIYSGSVGDFGYFKFEMGPNYTITSSTIPIFQTGSDGDTDWYSVLVQRRQRSNSSTNQYYDFWVKNNVFGEIGHQTSASLLVVGPTSNNRWYQGGTNYRLIFPPQEDGQQFFGQYQEIRLWSAPLSESVFDSHVLNPESIEGNYSGSAWSYLAARFPLGNNLYTYNHNLTSSTNATQPDQNQNISLHPNTPLNQIFTASYYNFPNRNNYSSFVETYYADVANSGLDNPVVNKVRIYSGSEYGTQLLPHQSIEIPPVLPITKDINFIDVGLSPQDEINRDIIAHFGSSYDLDDIIGNPSTSSYQQFQSLQQEYFKKYIRSYDYKDYIRLIEFFHNSLFRMLKDFTPARTNMSTGIVIKPHLLERPVVYRPEPFVSDPNNEEVTIDTAFISASNGGGYTFIPYYYNQPTSVGSYITLLSNGDDFFTGEFLGSTINYHYIYNFLNQNPFRYFNNYTLFSTTSNINYVRTKVWNYYYNALQNNVPNSILSNDLKKVNYINDNNGNLLKIYEPISYQDFTNNYQRHIYPRYLGTKTTSVNYNVYENSFANTLQKTYGRTPSIDKNTIQFAYFNQAIATGSQILAAKERTNLNLKYLIDESSNLTELVQRDYRNIEVSELWNLYQVQNIFKIGETVNISLFDNQIPTKQKSLDGNKKIFAGGIKYIPVLWRQIQDETLDFQSNIPQVLPTSLTAPSNYSGGQWYGQGNGQIYGYVDMINPSIVNGVLPFDIRVTIGFSYTTYEVLWNGQQAIFGPRYQEIDVVIPQLSSNGLPNFRGVFGPFNTWNTRRLNWITNPSIIRARANTGNIDVFTITDTNPILIVDNADNSWVSCSRTLSSHINSDLETIYFAGTTTYSNNPIIQKYLTGSIPPEAPIEINVGDLVRFDSGSKLNPDLTENATEFFKLDNEFVVTEIRRFDPLTNPNFTFRLNKPVPASLYSTIGTGSIVTNIIERYIFSRRVEDESNIVINFEKNPGVTSGGVVKNINLTPRVNDKIGNIVSGLKSKIFSTVLTS